MLVSKLFVQWNNIFFSHLTDSNPTFKITYISYILIKNMTYRMSHVYFIMSKTLNNEHGLFLVKIIFLIILKDD